MGKPSFWQKNIDASLFRATGFLFPVFDELQYMLVVATGFAVVIFTKGALADLLNGWVYVIVVGLVTFQIVKRRKMGVTAKVWACLIYYGFFAALAQNALDSHSLSPHHLSSVAGINYLLIKALLILAVARGFIVVMAIRFDSYLFEEAVSQHFKDTQYQPAAFGLISLVAFVAVLILHNFYDVPSVCALLSFTYANLFIKLFGRYTPLIKN